MFWLGFIKDSYDYQKMPWGNFHDGQKKGPMYRIGMIETAEQRFLFTVRVFHGGEYAALWQWALCFDALFAGALKVGLDNCGYYDRYGNAHGVEELWIVERQTDSVKLTYSVFDCSFLKTKSVDFDSFFPNIPETHGDLFPNIPPYPGQPTLTVPLKDIKAFFDANCLHMFPGRTSDDPPWYPLQTLAERMAASEENTPATPSAPDDTPPDISDSIS